MKYFGGRLNGFTVFAGYNGGPWELTASGWVDFISREIHIPLTEFRELMPSYLLRHMAHAVTLTLDNTEEAWISEMQRLREAARRPRSKVLPAPDSG